MSSLTTDPVQSCCDILVRSLSQTKDDNNLKMAAAAIARSLIESCGEDARGILDEGADLATDLIDQSDDSKQQFTEKMFYLHNLVQSIGSHLERFGI